MKEIVLSDNSVNSYGFRVLTEGLDIEQYKKNPIILYMHNRPFDGNPSGVIGKMTNLRYDGDKLIGTPEFDMEDELACKIAKKYEKGYLNMCSIGFDIIETSEAPEHLLVGQISPTVTKSVLREVSIVDIGSNNNATVLEYDNLHEALQAGKHFTLSFKTNIKHIKYTLNMTKIATALGLAEDAKEEEILAKISVLSDKASQTDRLLKEAELARQQEVAILINQAIDEGKLSKDNVSTFTDIAEKAGIETLKATLACMAKPVRPIDLIQPGSNTGIPDWDECDKNGTLYSIKQNQPEIYKQMFDKKFGKR